GLPAAIGAQMAHPKSLVIDIAGEASILMNMQEMSTAAQHRLPVKIFILNNQYLGMVRQWQELLHGNRLSHTYMDSLPDFVKLAEAYGCAGLRCETPGDVDAVIKKAMEIGDRPVVIDFIVHRDAMVWPMVPAGTSNDDIQVARDMAPDWGSSE
ncbi:MAG TPA: thiamine pyrophosphate-dependent enzyme, partial [Mycobacterium sp.]|nr:thiamine pyrophosphate-dependent enzyme [Mycobacterium sp.]